MFLGVHHSTPSRQDRPIDPPIPFDELLGYHLSYERASTKLKSTPEKDQCFTEPPKASYVLEETEALYFGQGTSESEDEGISSDEFFEEVEPPQDPEPLSKGEILKLFALVIERKKEQLSYYYSRATTEMLEDRFFSIANVAQETEEYTRLSKLFEIYCQQILDKIKTDPGLLDGPAQKKVEESKKIDIERSIPEYVYKEVFPASWLQVSSKQFSTLVCPGLYPVHPVFSQEVPESVPGKPVMAPAVLNHIPLVILKQYLSYFKIKFKNFGASQASTPHLHHVMAVASHLSSIPIDLEKHELQILKEFLEKIFKLSDELHCWTEAEFMNNPNFKEHLIGRKQRVEICRKSYYNWDKARRTRFDGIISRKPKARRKKRKL